VLGRSSGANCSKPLTVIHSRREFLATAPKAGVRKKGKGGGGMARGEAAGRSRQGAAVRQKPRRSLARQALLGARG